MQLLINPTANSFSKAEKFIKVLDQTKNTLSSNSAMLSKVMRNVQTVKPSVLRFFESPEQINAQYGDGEFDLVSTFKLYTWEAYFERAVLKKLALFFKSGQSISSEDDDITEYFQKRFLIMQMQTGISLHTLLRQIAFYLMVCSNAWVIKVRSKECDFATSYKKDSKDLNPVVGLFLAHPTTMKPKWKWVKESGMWKAKLDKWIQTNKRGQIKEFPIDDVVHFAVNKQDGMLLGTPEIVPVINDIKTLRKLEEDIGLLMHRDLFPIIHYNIEKPQVLDHTTGLTELEQARRDMQAIVQDGGIATDHRHKIELIGSKGKGIDAEPYLKYFQQRVFTGLGVSALDMSIAEAGNLGSAQTVSNAIIDSVKFLQQEISDQFEQHILMELVLQSPFASEVDITTMPRLKFEEIDLEWKIKQENHEADMFTKGVTTIHEVRNKKGDKTATDDDLMYTHPSLYGAQPAHKTMLDTPVGDKYATLQKKIDPPKPTTTTSASNKKKPKGTNSNTVKKKAHDCITLTDSMKSAILRDEFISVFEKLQDKSKTHKKLSMTLVVNHVYDTIKSNMAQKIEEGMEQAAIDLGLEDYDTRITHNIFKPLDSLRDELVTAVSKDSTYVNRAANRISITDRTEQNRAYNYGYALVCVNNNHNKFTICSDFNDIAEDSADLIGKELSIDKVTMLKEIPPFRPNSRLKLKVQGNKDNQGDSL